MVALVLAALGPRLVFLVVEVRVGFRRSSVVCL